jgi:hypothetical protein
MAHRCPDLFGKLPVLLLLLPVQLADGTYTWSDVVYDRATTENQSNSRSAVADVSTLTTKTNTISDTVDGHTSQLSSITSTQTTIQVAPSSRPCSSGSPSRTPQRRTSQRTAPEHVTTTALHANAWNLAVPTYNASYRLLLLLRVQYLNDTYGWSAVTRDIATGEMQERARTAITNAAAADTKAGNAASAAAAADTKAANAATAAATADGKAVSAQNTANKNLKESQQLWFTKANSTARASRTQR